MQSYITKPKSVKRKEIVGRGWSFSTRDYRFLYEKSNNVMMLQGFLKEKAKTGREIGSESYMKKSQYRFLKTVNISNNFCLDESSIEYCKPDNKIFPQKDDILIVKDGGGNGLGQICIYNKDNRNHLDSISAGIITLNVKEEWRYYVLGILKSNHFKEFVDLNTSQGSTIRHSKLVALQYKIPIPTPKNNPNLKAFEELVSCLVQNTIDKEE